MKKDIFFVTLFCIILVIPTIARIGEEEKLKGFNDYEKVEISNYNLWNGIYQSYLANNFEKKMSGRTFMIKIRNEILFSLLHTSPNQNVVIGKNKSLFESVYIYFQTQVYTVSDEELKNKVENLIKLDQIIKENNKELYVFITPSKARFCEDDFPMQLDILKTKMDYSKGVYERFQKLLSNTSIKTFDGIKFITNSTKNDCPIFYKTGIHWSNVWGNKAAAEFAKYISLTSKYELSNIGVEVKKVEEPKSPDSDLFDTCNIFSKPYDNYYEPILTRIDNSNEKPNVFCRGGSFMGQSIGMLFENQVFNNCIYFENNYYRTTQNQEWVFIDNFDDYKDMKIKEMLKSSDILIFEVNEGAINNMSFGFIDYLLQELTVTN